MSCPSFSPSDNVQRAAFHHNQRLLHHFFNSPQDKCSKSHKTTMWLRYGYLKLKQNAQQKHENKIKTICSCAEA